MRVSAGTFQIVDTRYGIDSAEHVVVAAGTAATLDATSVTVTAKTGRGTGDARTLTLTSTATLAVGRKYILEAADGCAEIVRIAAVMSGTTARTAAAIRHTYTTGATLRGIEVRATFPAAPAADDNNLDGEAFLVVWSFPGLPPVRESVFLERAEEAQLATLDELRELDGGLAGADATDPVAALSRAHKDLRVDLQLVGIGEADYITGPIGSDAVLYRAAYHLAEQKRDDARAVRYHERYKQLRDALVIGNKKAQVVSVTQADQVATRANPARLFFGWGFGDGS